MHRVARNVVVGTGPCGAMAAAALVARGLEVTFVDVGMDLDLERSRTVARLARHRPEHWDRDALSLVEHRPQPGDGPARKLWFGSEAVYDLPPGVELDAQGVGCVPSFAGGGLSNVWGATMLPYATADLEDWPAAVTKGLLEAYGETARRVPIAGKIDDLADPYPFFGPRLPSLRLHPAAADLEVRLMRQRGMLRRRGVTGGRARLAVRSGSPAPGSGCLYCGRCLDGCFYGHIWSARSLRDELLGTDGVDLVRGRVTYLRERRQGVDVGIQLEDGEAELRCERAFIAAGALSTAHLLQRSGLVREAIHVRDSQTIFLPLLDVGRLAPSGESDMYALAQLFLRIEHGAGAPASQVQLYAHNPGLRARARAQKALLRFAPDALLDRVLRQLTIAIGYLHSDRSAGIEVTLGKGGALRLRPLDREKSLRRSREWLGNLATHLAPLRLRPLGALADIAAPGGGFHLGASFPMSDLPATGRHSTDLVGRPPRTERIHLVDTSVLPSIPAGPVTYTAMANAWRIAIDVAAGA